MISKSDLRKMSPGSVQYVFAHGNRQKQKGKNFSATIGPPLIPIKNPIKAYHTAKKIVEYKPKPSWVMSRRLDMLLGRISGPGPFPS